MNDGLLAGWFAGTPFEVMQGGTLAALVAGALLPLLGIWVVLQRVVFLGVALAQVAAAGVALGLLLGVPALPLGLVCCGVMVLAFTPRTLPGRGPGGDSALGAAFCIASALALLFISRSPLDLDQVNHVLHGNLIFTTPAESGGFALALFLGVLLVTACFQPILFAAFDGETAAALGLSPRRWLLLLFGVLALVLTLSMRTTGALLGFALLVLPPLAALRLRRGLRATLALSSLLGLLAAAAGLVLAVRADLHVESSIVVAAFLLLPLAWLWTKSPWLSLAAAAGLAALVPQFAPAEVAPPGARHAHSQSASFDVHLSARRADGGLTLEWTLDVHRAEPDAPLPPAIWLLVQGAGPTSGHALVPDTSALPEGDALLTGRTTLPDAPGAGTLSGQLWTGPLTDPRALPIGGASVASCEIAGP